MQAEHGQVLVVAASHLIFLLRQPSQALITECAYHVSVLRKTTGATERLVMARTLQPLVPVVFIHEDIVYDRC